MRIAGITDIHGRMGFDLAEDHLRRADLVLISGDITNFGGEEEARPIIERIRSVNSTVYAVSGNCDHSGVARLLGEMNISLEGTCVRDGGVVAAGLGGSLPGPSSTPNEYSEEEIDHILADAAGCAGSSGILVLVSHQPPRGTLNDRLSSGEHVGSVSVRDFIEKNRPAVCLCGHIHEGMGIDRIGETATVNPGPFRTGNLALIDVDGEGVVRVSIVRNGEEIQKMDMR
jgi:hypothetical protein